MRPRVRRRTVLLGASAGATAAVAARSTPARATAGAPAPVTLDRVTLLPSPFRDAADRNRAYLFRLEPERLLHNFRVQAGLQPLAPAYGGWEAESLAGHTLGHYLSALSLDHAASGDAESRARVDAIVRALAACQAAGGDGYVGGLTRTAPDGTVEGGRAVFDLLRGGTVEVRPFSLNGAWSPLYTLHKLLAGLLDAQQWCGNDQALAVARALADYLGDVFNRLDDAALQRVLACEYGGLNESFAELAVRTGERRWLVLGERIRDRRTLDPLARGIDDLGGLHANTQIPKLVGLARLAAITGCRADAAEAATFWRAATRHHSFPIGGNGDQEYFWSRDAGALHLTEQTCETCASYNMLKLTALLYARDRRAAYFDWYERTLLNHIMAQQNPRTGMFAYMTPVMSGAARQFSTPFDDFWCCVGTGMESHAKHGIASVWQDGDDAVLVNLFIPAIIDCGGGVRLRIETGRFPNGSVSVWLDAAPSRRTVSLRLRLPAWSRRTTATLNGAAIEAAADADGYLTLRRRWRSGDAVTLELDTRIRLEWLPGATRAVAVLRGPHVMALDLGPADAPLADQDPPVLVARNADGALAAAEALPLVPFADGHERRSAVVFPVRTEAEQQRAIADRRSEVAARTALLAEAIDRLVPGEDKSERAHALRSALSYTTTYRGRTGRDAREGGFVAFRLQATPAAATLALTFWATEGDRRFRVLVDGAEIARDDLAGGGVLAFVDRRYAVPAGSADRQAIAVRIEPRDNQSAPTIYGVLLLLSGANATTAL